MTRAPSPLSIYKLFLFLLIYTDTLQGNDVAVITSQVSHMKKQSRKQTGKSLLASSGPPDHDTLDVDGIDHDMGDNRRFSGNKAAAAASKSKKKNTSKSKKKGRRWSVEEENKDEYCICRQGYDGNEFMIECDGCQGNEWQAGISIRGKKKNCY